MPLDFDLYEYCDVCWTIMENKGVKSCADCPYGGGAVAAKASGTNVVLPIKLIK